jgi:hypothetical protein
MATPPPSAISDQGGRNWRVPGRFAVSRRGPRRQENPGLARAGLANPGFYAESEEYHSVRERTPEVNPQTWPVPDPLAMVARILRHPWFPPARPVAQGRGTGASDMSPVGRRRKLASCPRLPSASLQIRDGPSSASFGRTAARISAPPLEPSVLRHPAVEPSAEPAICASSAKSTYVPICAS